MLSPAHNNESDLEAELVETTLIVSRFRLFVGYLRYVGKTKVVSTISALSQEQFAIFKENVKTLSRLNDTGLTSLNTANSNWKHLNAQATNWT